jgi:uncharacterized coiled-coil DUF342 family protein
MDLEELRGKLESAKEEIGNASNRAQEIAREAGWMESEADSAWSAIDDILDNVTEYQSIDMDQHKMLIRLSGRVSKLSHYLYRAIIDSASGTPLSNEDETRARDAISILERLFKVDPIDGDGSPNREFVVKYDYNEYAWIIKQNKEENNG